MLGELDFIEALRAIATDPAARGLADDAAVLGDLVLTHDSIAEGCISCPHDPPASVGWKLVTVNLSDLAAKGAEPVAALMSADHRRRRRMGGGFLAGVAAACEAYKAAAGRRRHHRAAGGRAARARPDRDRPRRRTCPSRAGGQPGDRLWLVGTLGDAAAGLARCEADASRGPLVEAYRRPVPQLAAGRRSRRMPRDDGRVRRAAARRLRGCAPRAVRRAIDLDALPLSAPSSPSAGSIARAAVRGDRRRRLCAARRAARPIRPALSLSLPPDDPVADRHADRWRRHQPVRRRGRGAATGAPWL
jgi:thiamine-monophosphate kinase